jgi:hypothetical protein
MIVPTTPSKRSKFAAAAVGLLLVVSLLAALAAPAAGQSTSVPYYNNSSTDDVNNETWLVGIEDPSLENVTSLLLRTGSYVIGTGDVGGPEGGEGQATGAVVLGLTAFAVLLGILGGSGVGSVGGTVLSTAVAAGLVQTGFAPGWMWAVVLFGVGLLLSTVVIRALR